MHVVRALKSLAATAVASTTLVYGASYNIQNARLTVQSFDGSPRVTEKYASQDAVVPKLLAVEPDDVIKFSFSVADDKGIPVSGDRVPQQVWVTFSDAARSEKLRSFVWPLRVRGSSASASYSLRMNKLNQELRQTLVQAGPDHAFDLTLLIGSFAHHTASQSEALALPFLRLTFSESLLARFPAQLPSKREIAQAQDGFLPHPNHVHTFATEPWQTMPPSVMSLGAALGVLIAPWLLLTRLWKPLVTRLESPNKPETLFLASLYTLEALAAAYWIGAPYYIVFPATLALAVGAALSARQALARAFVL